MKIFHIITSLGGGGRERRMTQLVNGLVECGYDQVILLTGGKNSRQDYEVSSNVRIFKIENTGGYIKRFQSISRIISKEKPEIVHLWTEVPSVLLTATVLKYIYQYKLIVGFLADGNPVKKLTCKISNSLAFGVGDAIVSNSLAGLKAKKASLKKSHVIYNGFDFKRINNNSIVADDIKELLLQNKKIVTMVARFNVAKNWEMFLELAQKAQLSRQDDIMFLAVGSGEQLEHYKKQAKDRDLRNIKFLGQRSDVENILLNTDVSVLFSNDQIHAEGVSNSIMESMAVGCPVIATNGGGTSEIIKNEDTGFIVDPGDVDNAFHKMNILLNNIDLRNRFGERGIDIIKNTFTLSEMTRQYLKLYNSL